MAEKENSRLITPLVKKIQEDYGVPLEDLNSIVCASYCQGKIDAYIDAISKITKLLGEET